MTAPRNKPIPDDVLVRFAAYARQHLTWGSLHIVLDDGNVRDSDVAFCQKYARERGDAEGAFLADVLAGCSKSQRLNLPRRMAYAQRLLDEKEADEYIDRLLDSLSGGSAGAI